MNSMFSTKYKMSWNSKKRHGQFQLMWSLGHFSCRVDDVRTPTNTTMNHQHWLWNTFAWSAVFCIYIRGSFFQWAWLTIAHYIESHLDDLVNVRQYYRDKLVINGWSMVLQILALDSYKVASNIRQRCPLVVVVCHCLFQSITNTGTSTNQHLSNVGFQWLVNVGRVV